jgi:predicted DNA-binding protein (UPF0278 family)
LELREFRLAPIAGIIGIKAFGFMALTAVPDEVAEHFEAALFLSQRNLYLRLLSEAELLAKSAQLNAAFLLAGIALEEITRFSVADVVTDEARNQINLWREIRNQSVHSGSPETTKLTAEQFNNFVRSIREMLDRAGASAQCRSKSPTPIDQSLIQTRGKYAFVKTSVEEFLKHKREDLEAEDPKCL